MIFQLIDDHSRLAVATHVAWDETSEGAIAVVKKGIAAHGVPQRLLTDNGAALNPSRRGAVGQLVTYVTRFGVEPITGKPYKPTTRGEKERFHQTLFRWLDKQPLAALPRPRLGKRHRKPTRLGHETNSNRLAGTASAAPRSPPMESFRSAKPGSMSPGSWPGKASI